MQSSEHVRRLAGSVFDSLWTGPARGSLAVDGESPDAALWVVWPAGWSSRGDRVDGDCGKDAVAELAAWLGETVASAGLTHCALAARIHWHRSGVTRVLSGTAPLPSWPMTEAIARACCADAETAGRLWEAAHQAVVMRARRVADGWPPDDLAHHDDLCRALRALVKQRRISLRELVDKDTTGVLTRSMAGYVLRADRRATYRVMIAIIAVCGVPPSAEAEWQAAWWRVVPVEIETRRRAQLAGLRDSQGGRLYWMGGRSW